MSRKLLECRQLTKIYRQGSSAISVLADVNFALSEGEQVAVLGSSGSGKSTLLHLLGALDTPSAGQVLFRGRDIFQYSASQQAEFRNSYLGFVYQQHHLLPEFDALENVAMPLLIAGRSKKQAYRKASSLLDRVDMNDRQTHKPAELSGGERQRVAIARALVAEPALVLADEPTGNLDDVTGAAVYQLLLDLKREYATSFVVVTHDRTLAAKLDRTVYLRQGELLQTPADQGAHASHNSVQR